MRTKDCSRVAVLSAILLAGCGSEPWSNGIIIEKSEQTETNIRLHRGEEVFCSHTIGLFMTTQDPGGGVHTFRVSQAEYDSARVGDRWHNGTAIRDYETIAEAGR